MECALLNSFVLNNMTFPSHYTQRGHSKRDLLAFRLDVAKQLIEGFQSQRKSAGWPRNMECQSIKRLNVQMGHWPVRVEKKLECTARINQSAV